MNYCVPFTWSYTKISRILFFLLNFFHFHDNILLYYRKQMVRKTKDLPFYIFFSTKAKSLFEKRVSFFLFERKKKQQSCGLTAVADSLDIPFDVLFSRLSHGVSKRKKHNMLFSCSDTAKSNEHQKHIFDLRVMRLCDC